MTPKIVKLNASSLYAAGFDRPTVEALLNLLRITGNATDGVTVPELSGQVDSNTGIIADIQNKIVIIQLSTDLLESAPPVIQPGSFPIDSLGIIPPQIQAQQIEYLQTEVRQLAEQIAQVSEFLQTEVRQIADQQISNANLIQELKQGTML